MEFVKKHIFDFVGSNKSNKIEHRSRERKLEKKRKISDIVRLKEIGEKREGVQNFLLAKRLGTYSIQFIFDVPQVSLSLLGFTHADGVHLTPDAGERMLHNIREQVGIPSDHHKSELKRSSCFH